MTLCIPVTEDRGLASPLCAHFGSAPLFLVVEPETGACRAIFNSNQHHAHGMCHPLAALSGQSIDAMVVGGIGMGALGKLMAAGIKVYLAEQETVEQVLAAHKAGSLREATPESACGHHGHGPHGQGRPSRM
jgi:predicted Fe-Mo cluster-binding NifX family protein